MLSVSSIIKVDLGREDLLQLASIRTARFAGDRSDAGSGNCVSQIGETPESRLESFAGSLLQSGW